MGLSWQVSKKFHIWGLRLLLLHSCDFIDLWLWLSKKVSKRAESLRL